MRPGWYSHVNDPRIVAYFNGTVWGSITDGLLLPSQIQNTLTALPPGHPGVAAPFESRTSIGRFINAGWWWCIGAPQSSEGGG